MNKTTIVAEIGVNHNGSLPLAEKLIDAAITAGCNMVKFQSFVAEEGISQSAPKADYQLKLTSKSERQFDMIKRLELSYSDHVQLIDYCRKKNVQFLTTVCDLKSIEMIAGFNLPALKIASCDLVNVPLLRSVARLKKKVILATGMSTQKEIARAVAELKDNGAAEIVLMHCTTEYPCPPEEINLNKMISLREAFHLPVGFSDHSLGITAAMTAVALGAVILEKHFTMDKKWEGPDHKASVDPEEMAALVKAVRTVEQSLGSSLLEPSSSERHNLAIMRRKIVAAKTIRAGEVFDENNLGFKRATGGITPDYVDQIVGTKAKKDYQCDEVIPLE